MSGTVTDSRLTAYNGHNAFVNTVGWYADTNQQKQFDIYLSGNTIYWSYPLAQSNSAFLASNPSYYQYYLPTITFVYGLV